MRPNPIPAIGSNLIRVIRVIRGCGFDPSPSVFIRADPWFNLCE